MLTFNDKTLTELLQIEKEVQNMTIDDKVAFYEAKRQKCNVLRRWKLKTDLDFRLKELKEAHIL